MRATKKNKRRMESDVKGWSKCEWEKEGVEIIDMITACRYIIHKQ